MPQFLLKPDDIEEKRFTLSGAEAFHVTRVLRHKTGDSVELFDGHGGRYTGIIRQILSDGTVIGDITGRAHAPHRDFAVDLRVYIGLLKASAWEAALEKCTEIGASVFIPTITPRTVVRLKDFEGKKRERWEKKLEAASKQCRRASLPRLEAPVHFRDAIAEAAKEGLTLLAWEKRSEASTHASLREVLRKARKTQEKGLRVNLFIGPEGGFSDEEIELADCEGAAIFSLGENTLRAETAAIAASAMVFYGLGAIG